MSGFIHLRLFIWTAEIKAIQASSHADRIKLRLLLVSVESCLPNLYVASELVSNPIF